jgi:hypothetical protein
MILIELSEINYECRRWMDVAEDHVQWQFLVFVLLNLWILPSERFIFL